VYGKAAYLAAIVTVFGHPGRRFGMMVRTLFSLPPQSVQGPDFSRAALRDADVCSEGQFQVLWLLRHSINTKTNC